MAGKLRTRRAQIGMKLEAIEGTQETLGAADVVLVHNPTYSPDIQTVPRTPARASFSPLPSIVGKQMAGIGFGMELKGTGNVATPPDWDLPIRACGFQRLPLSSIPLTGAITGGPFEPGEIVTGGTSSATALVLGRVATGATTLYVYSITGGPFQAETLTGSRSGASVSTSGADVAAQGFVYLPISTGEISVTTGLYLDGLLLPIAGARGTFSIRAQNGGLGLFDFDFTGKFIQPTDEALIAGVTYEDEIPPAFLNVGLFAHDFAPTFAAVGYNHANAVQPRENAGDASGYESFMITDRKPAITIDPELTLVADHDWYGKVRSGAPAVFHAEVGAGAGSRVLLASPKAQYTRPNQGERSSLATLSLNLPLSSGDVNSGDDEIQIAVF